MKLQFLGAHCLSHPRGTRRERMSSFLAGWWWHHHTQLRVVFNISKYVTLFPPEDPLSSSLHIRWPYFEAIKIFLHLDLSPKHAKEEKLTNLIFIDYLSVVCDRCYAGPLLICICLVLCVHQFDWHSYYSRADRLKPLV